MTIKGAIFDENLLLGSKHMKRLRIFFSRRPYKFFSKYSKDSIGPEHLFCRFTNSVTSCIILCNCSCRHIKTKEAVAVIKSVYREAFSYRFLVLEFRITLLFYLMVTLMLLFSNLSTYLPLLRTCSHLSLNLLCIC